ncbi:MAG: hypothetical protein JWM37_624 [Candidatus Saccharibacteria bacterium]|nr:hypothetical protein [Candidatus Saccharibacteria bacterium]
MKITKFTHSCLLVEMSDRTVLFDPGVMSQPLLEKHTFVYLDDIAITHQHGDHMAIDFIITLAEQFPEVRITAPGDALKQLHEAGLTQATNQLPEGFTRFDAPHEVVEPMFPTPEEIGYHYLGKLSHPGDSHHFTETSPILALPVTAPWGSTVKAVQLALELKPKYIIPIHDWHWRDEARQQTYDSLAQIFAKNGIEFVKAKDGEPFNLDV